MASSKNASKFETKDIDASINIICWILLCPCTFGAVPYSTQLHLDEEEVTKTDKNLCCKTVSKRPYGELGSVDRSNCLCCVSAQSGFGEISPGCGCETETVDEIVDELKQRQRGRGDTAQIQRAEQTLNQLDNVEKKLDLILEHLNIPTPLEMEDR